MKRYLLALTVVSALVLMVSVSTRDWTQTADAAGTLPDPEPTQLDRIERDIAALNRMNGYRQQVVLEQIDLLREDVERIRDSVAAHQFELTQLIEFEVVAIWDELDVINHNTLKQHQRESAALDEWEESFRAWQAAQP